MSSYIRLERTLSLQKHLLFENPGSPDMASLDKKRILRHSTFLQSIFRHISDLDDTTKDFDDKLAEIVFDYAHDEPRTAKADAIFALTSSFGQDEKSGGDRSLEVVTINALAVVHAYAGSSSPDGGHTFGEKSQSKQDVGQFSWNEIQENLEQIRIKTKTDPFPAKKMEGLDTANTKRHEQKNLIIPFCVVENKKSEHSVMQAINQVKLYSVSVAQFLAELQVYDFPIFGIATYGTKALVFLTWHTEPKPKPKPKTTGEEEEETDTVRNNSIFVILKTYNSV
ncbi:hypothetical protein H0H87_004842 [Tephrocybe sp. NHM501043]|nr:hypothetical protein H0H87_004842 [Tephrocybe sp. NHM501043]